MRLSAAPPAPQVRGARFSWGRLLVVAVAVVLLVPNSSVLEHRAVIAVFLLALASGRGREFVRDWLPLVGAAALFVFLRQLAATSPLPRRGAAIAQLEATLFGGTTPTTWLQQRFYTAGDARVLDYIATAIHASYFFGFVLVGLLVWLFVRERFRSYTRLLALTFALGLTGYFMVPTEPPWLAARQGTAPPAQRILASLVDEARLAGGMVAAGQWWQSDPDALGDPNPVAAMPSVHTSVTVALAIFLARLHPVGGAVGMMYATAMGLALVYLGEHYVLDLVAGAGCAAVAAMITLRRAPCRRQAGRACR